MSTASNNTTGQPSPAGFPSVRKANSFLSINRTRNALPPLLIPVHSDGSPPISGSKSSRESSTPLTARSFYGVENTDSPRTPKSKLKPLFLRDMEDYIARELSVLRNSTNPDVANKPSKQRLAVYRECFKVFIDHFPTYGYLLSSILLEYDNMVEHLSKKQDTLQLSGQFRDAEQQEAIQTIHNLKTHYEMLLSSAQEEKEKLEKEVEQLHDEEKRYKRELKKLGDVLATARTERQEELERNITLSNALKHADEKYLAMKQRFIQIETENNSLQQMQEMYAESWKKLQDVENLVSRSDLEKQQTIVRDQEIQIRNLQSQLKMMKLSIDRQTSQISMLQDSSTDLRKERDQLHRKLNNLTPRPDWPQITTDDALRFDFEDENCPEFEVKYDISKTTSTMVHSLIAVIAKLKKKVENTENENGKLRSALSKAEAKRTVVSDTETVSGLGSSPAVPVHLRFEGVIRIQRLSNYEVRGLIHEIWKQRTAYLQAHRQDRSNMSEFFISFLANRHENEATVIAESSYSIVRACELFSEDAVCALFLKILQGVLSEDVYFDQMAMLVRLKSALIMVDERHHSGKTTGVLDRELINWCLEQVFPTKSESNMEKLKNALGKEESSLIEYLNLFKDDSSDFIELLRLQHLQCIQEYMLSLTKVANEMDTDQDGILRLEDFKTAIYTLEPQKHKREVLLMILAGSELNFVPPYTAFAQFMTASHSISRKSDEDAKKQLEATKVEQARVIQQLMEMAKQIQWQTPLSISVFLKRLLSRIAVHITTRQSKEEQTSDYTSEETSLDSFEPSSGSELSAEWWSPQTSNVTL